MCNNNLLYKDESMHMCVCMSVENRLTSWQVEWLSQFRSRQVRRQQFGRRTVPIEILNIRCLWLFPELFVNTNRPESNSRMTARRWKKTKIRDSLKKCDLFFREGRERLIYFFVILLNLKCSKRSFKTLEN